MRLRLAVFVTIASVLWQAPTGRAGLLTQLPSLAVLADGRAIILNTATGSLTVASDQRLQTVWKVPFDFRPGEVLASNTSVIVLASSKEAAGGPVAWRFEPSTMTAVPLPLPRELSEQIVTRAAISPDGGTLFLATARRTLIRLALGPGRQPTAASDKPMYLPFAAGAVAVGNSGKIAVSATENPWVAVFPWSGDPRRFTVDRIFVTSLGFAGDGRSLLIGGPDRSDVLRLDVESGATTRIPTPGFPPASVAMGRDGTLWIIDPNSTRLEHIDSTGKPISTHSLRGKS